MPAMRDLTVILYPFQKLSAFTAASVRLQSKQCTDLEYQYCDEGVRGISKVLKPEDVLSVCFLYSLRPMIRVTCIEACVRFTLLSLKIILYSLVSFSLYHFIPRAATVMRGLSR